MGSRRPRPAVRVRPDKTEEDAIWHRLLFRMRLAQGMGGLVLVILLLPSVSACSLAGPGPDLPARLWVWDLEEAEVVHEQDIWHRGLDGDCGLVEPVDLDGGRLAYVDQAGPSKGVWLRDLDDEGSPRLVFRLDGHYIDLDLHGDLLAIYMQTHRHGGSQRFDHVLTVDLATGEARRQPFDVDWLGNPTVHDGILHWTAVDRSDYRHRLNAYDLTTDAWIYENVSMEDRFGLGERPRFHQMNRDWILFSDDHGDHVWDRQAKRLVPLEGPPDHRTALDSDLLYRSGYGRDLQVQRLPDGAPRNLTEPAHPIFRNSAYEDGLVVLGTYSADGPKRPPSWMRQPTVDEDFPLPSEWQHERPPWYERLSFASPALWVFFLLSIAVAARSRGARR